MRLLFVFTFLLSTPAFALVDMRNANYSDSWTDIEVPGAGFPLKMLRAYNSRSLYNGIFGFGWCSDIETSLEVTPESGVKVTECGDGAEIIYHNRDFSKVEVEETVDKILAAAKKESPNLPPASVSKLKGDLLSDRSMREDYALKYKIVSKIVEGKKLYASGRENETVSRDKAGYIRTLVDGSLQKFDLEGKMTYLYDKSGNFLKYTYQGSQLTEIVDNQGRKLSFQYYPSKKVKSISGPNRAVALYKYKGVSDLEWVQTAQGNAYTYKYDELHNLVEIGYPDKSAKKITYDKNKDWVTSLTDRNNCTEKYDWILSKEDPKNNYTSTITKTCDGKITNQSRFEFWFKTRPDGDGKYLARTLTKVNADETDTQFHPQFNKPTLISRNGVKTAYEYFPNGLVSTRTTGKIVTKFKYDEDTKKISEVRTGDKVTGFKYDKAGNLVSATSSDGLTVNLNYDDKGRIVSITDQGKRKVNIAYEDKFGKPKTVERPGVGSIEVSYKPNGEIKEVKSKQGGPTVAVQVASTFNSLLELVAPAGVDLGL